MTCTGEGIAEARDFRRKAENGGRWIVEDLGKIVGALGAVSRSERRIRVEVNRPPAEQIIRVRGDSKRQKRVYGEKISNKKKGFGDVWGTRGDARDAEQ